MPEMPGELGTFPCWNGIGVLMGLAMTKYSELAAFIGIDGGGTHSLAVAVDSNGSELAKTRAGSLNFFGSGLVAARRNLEMLVKALKRQLPRKTRFDGIVVGCAALFSDATRAEKKNLCGGI